MDDSQVSLSQMAIFYSLFSQFVELAHLCQNLASTTNYQPLPQYQLVADETCTVPITHTDMGDGLVGPTSTGLEPTQELMMLFDPSWGHQPLTPDSLVSNDTLPLVSDVDLDQFLSEFDINPELDLLNI